jgi:hypothetical protein
MNTLLISQIFFHEIFFSGKVKLPSPLLAERKMLAARNLFALDLINPQLCFPLVSATVNPPPVLPDEAAPLMPCSHAAVWNKQVRIWIRHSKSSMRYYPDLYVK